MVIYYLYFQNFPLDKCSICFLSDEVAVIDEIQMLKDQKRGWAWTRALLGIFKNLK